MVQQVKILPHAFAYHRCKEAGTHSSSLYDHWLNWARVMNDYGAQLIDGDLCCDMGMPIVEDAPKALYWPWQ